jgi:hypothetical protein
MRKNQMNERIKELADQAGIQIKPLIIDGEEYDYEEVMMDGYDDLKKFAELIVKECVDTVSDCSVEYCTRPQIVSEIKEHFGVE